MQGQSTCATLGNHAVTMTIKTPVNGMHWGEKCLSLKSLGKTGMHSLHICTINTYLYLDVYPQQREPLSTFAQASGGVYDRVT